MVALKWAALLTRRHPARVVATAVGAALAVALISSLGLFLGHAKGEMTSHAIRQVGLDWQVEVQPGSSPADIAAALGHRRDVQAALPVRYATAPAFSATTQGTTQTTGAGVVVGLPADYTRRFPSELRPLAGAASGVVLAQQTAANLHAGVGDRIAVSRSDGAPVELHVDGVIDVSEPDLFFQRVGVAVSGQRLAPPDNVLFVPADAFDAIVGPSGAAAAHTQFHVRVAHRLPPDPTVAYARETGRAHRFEVDTAGAAVVGDNLASALDASRSDSLYAQILFVLLGLPGVAIAALVARALADAFRDERRREQTLLRTRGANRRQLAAVVAAEIGTAGLVGGVAGWAVSFVVGRAAFGSVTYGASFRGAVLWPALAAVAAVIVTMVAVGVPAWRDASRVGVGATRGQLPRLAASAILRYKLDVVLLALGVAVFWASGRGGYKLVVAPEGVPTISVSYWTLVAPVLLWIAFGLLSFRAVEAFTRRQWLRRALRPVAGSIAGPVASTLRRDHSRLAVAVVVFALSFAFAVSTAAFNSTYRHQVAADALLTNGAAVTISAPAGSSVGAGVDARVAAVPGVSHVEPMQHRFVYVGADLQDLYGVRPSSIGRGGRLQDAYFSGGSARSLMHRLATQRDAALVSAETARDFQLHLGDALRLRVRTGSGSLIEVPFRYAGVVKEFPTAPTDSFVVANAAYIGAMTGDPSPSTLLVSARGKPPLVASRVRRAVPTAVVTDITQARATGSSLTAVDLSGLSKIELGYAAALVVAAAGLVFGLGLAARRRSLAIASALGARRQQLAAFARGEALVFAVVGGLCGSVGAAAVSHVLVKILTGVFDPPPSRMAVPWMYVAAILVIAAGAVLTGAAATGRSARTAVTETIRDL